MKKIVVRIVLGLVVLLLLAFAVLFFCLGSIVKKGVETVGPQLTKVEIRLGGANLSPLSGSGQLSDLFVGNPEGYKTPAAIRMGDIKVGVQLSSLLSDTVVVNAVDIRAPEITFEGSLGGNNLSKIMANLDAVTGGDKSAPQEEKKNDRKFQVKDLVIRDGKINLSVTALGGKAATVPLPEIHLTNIGVGGGVTAAELTKQVMKEMLAGVTKAVSGALGDIGKGVKDLGKEGTQQLEKATKGVTDLFKKKK
ncbi:MAG: hypothetical protein HYY24_15800 [Verrucomicrobia bacterium]|nr:hypothetical protein [Verrucomicrobiota bacterium]